MLFLGALADEQLAVLEGDYVAVKTLEDYLTGILAMHGVVHAVHKGYVTYSGVLMGVRLEFLMQGGPVAKVTPAKVCGMGVDKSLGGCGLHYGIVYADFLGRWEEFLHLGGILYYLVHELCYGGLIVTDAGGYGAGIPYKYAGIPQVIACRKVTLGGLKVRLFTELCYRNYLCMLLRGLWGTLNVTVTRFRPVGLDSYCYNFIVLLRKAEGRGDDAAELVGVEYHGIGRSYYYVAVRTVTGNAPAGPGYAGGCVAGCGLGKDMALRDAGELLTYYGHVILIGDYPEIGLRTDAQEAVYSELNEGAAAAKYIYELFGQLWSAEGPETGPYSTCHDYYLSFHL